MLDEFATEYSAEVTFVAPAWKGSPEATAARAGQLMPSGNILWGLDAQEEIFQAYGVPYQPVSVLIAADKTIFASWAGLRADDEIREAIDALIAYGG